MLNKQNDRKYLVVMYGIRKPTKGVKLENVKAMPSDWVDTMHYTRRCSQSTILCGRFHKFLRTPQGKAESVFLDFVSERYKVPPHRYIFDEKILTHSERYDIDASVALLAAAENINTKKR